MKKSKILKSILIVSGAVAAIVGASIVMFPSAFYETYGITLGSDVSLINELKAPGGICLEATFYSCQGHS